MSLRARGRPVVATERLLADILGLRAVPLPLVTPAPAAEDGVEGSTLEAMERFANSGMAIVRYATFDRSTAPALRRLYDALQDLFTTPGASSAQEEERRPTGTATGDEP